MNSDDDSRLRALFAEAHRDDPLIPFGRGLAARRRSVRMLPRLAAATCAAIVLAATIGIFRTPPPAPLRVAAPLKGWHAPTDFLLANRTAHTHTDFLLRTPSLSPDSLKGAPR